MAKQNLDYMSNVLDNVADKIMEFLPIGMAARTSLLSKQWRSSWLSLKCLDFNEDFFEKHEKNEDGSCNWTKCANSISNILLHHNGDVNDFKLFIPEFLDEEAINLSNWLSFLSKNAVKCIILDNAWGPFLLSSNIFSCTELVNLHLDDVYLPPSPSNFTGFRKLKSLFLGHVRYSKEDDFQQLIAMCPILNTLTLVKGDVIVIESRSLETLSVWGRFKYLWLKDVRNLKTASLSPTIEAFHPGIFLASLSQLECIEFGVDVCMYLVAAQSAPMIFGKLKKLSFGGIDLCDSHAMTYIVRMIENSPIITELEICVVPSHTGNQQEEEISWKSNLTLDHLLELKISGIRGSNVELKFIEQMLATSVVLKSFWFSCVMDNPESELKVIKALFAFPRASSRARVVEIPN